jgi:hypothetical protein
MRYGRPFHGVIVVIGYLILLGCTRSAEFKMKDSTSITGDFVEEMIGFETRSGQALIRSDDVASFSIGTRIRFFQDVVSGDVSVSVPQRPLIFRGVKLKNGKNLTGNMIRSSVRITVGSRTLTLPIEGLDSYIPPGQKTALTILPRLPFTLQRAVVKKGLEIRRDYKQVMFPQLGDELDKLFYALSRETPRDPEVIVDEGSDPLDTKRGG